MAKNFYSYEKRQNELKKKKKREEKLKKKREAKLGKEQENADDTPVEQDAAENDVDEDDDVDLKDVD